MTEPNCPRCGSAELRPAYWGENNAFVDADTTEEMSGIMLCNNCGYGFRVTFKVDEITEHLHQIICPEREKEDDPVRKAFSFEWCLIAEGHKCDYCLKQLTKDDHQDHRIPETVRVIK